ncbi:MAG: FecR domain-containing protein [Labilithrix sp.]|nr:FecR domain-containing protein [Labilithrix sp.]
MRRALVVAIVLAAVEARADDVRHVVKANESCSSIAQRYYGDGRFVDLLHGANPELAKMPRPHVLREGMVLVIPAKAADQKAPDAQLTAVQNQVDVLAPEAKPGRINDPLFRGNRVSTRAASAADVTFRDETQVKLGERTLVIILGDAKSAASKPTTSETQLVTGNLRAFMAGAPGKAAGVGTDAATVKVYDGEAQVSADAVKTTRLAVYGGSSKIDARGRSHDVARGFGSKAELGRPPTPPRPLPVAPVWSSSPPLVLLDDGAAIIEGEYDVPASPERNTKEWHVQIARDGIFRDVAVDTKVPAAVKRLEAQPPGPGRYYIRVSAIDDDQFEGPFGRIARTIVLRATESTEPGGRRRIEIEPPDAFCVRVGNVRLARVDGPLLVAEREPVRLRCAPNDSDPTTLLILDKPAK